jgi:hypothetical protein
VIEGKEGSREHLGVWILKQHKGYRYGQDGRRSSFVSSTNGEQLKCGSVEGGTDSPVYRTSASVLMMKVLSPRSRQ